MLRVVFMGTPDFAVPSLQALIDSQRVVGVVTQPDREAGRGRVLRQSPVKQIALEANIPIYQPLSLKSEESAQPLRDWKPDVIVVAAFGHILRKHILELPRHGCLNIHASLLPLWRGASPIQRALLAGDEQTGISLMKMDEGMDTGPVYLQRFTPIDSSDTAASLHDRLALIGADLVKENLDDIIGGRLEAIPQDDSLASYAPLIKKSDGEIDWLLPGDSLERLVRAMTPWPGAYTWWAGKQLKILKSQPAAVGHLPAAAPGQVIRRGDVVFVRAGSGGLILEIIQLEGKSSMAVDDFVRGRPEFVGSVLGR